MTTTKCDTQLLALKTSEQCWAIRFDPRRPIMAYITLDRWCREGILPGCHFGYLLCKAIEAAQKARGK